ncbi:hypothetical protein BELL_0075g00030 [Botrytis elliptica]|uniref:Major facilitator superfamily (MFS) profile domain-containing protein n=1 Tax=Botrytis elliptica TaxID=278938 RepID=A0A4Z1K9V3_9HELO|nr:hypothetical protein BELL_0075g00030 [Botrytis elliptica]
MVPTIGLAMVGSGTTAIIVSNANYLVDAYSKYAASALIENAALAFIPLASASMYTDLRFQWASSLLAFLSLALVATPFAVFKWGKQIRSRSPFMKEAIIERHHAVLQQPLRNYNRGIIILLLLCWVCELYLAKKGKKGYEMADRSGSEGV